MAITIPNQPITFDEVLDCSLDSSEIKVLAQWGDITQFQMKLEPCGSDFDIVVNGNFASSSNWTLGSGWSISGGQACHIAGLFGSISQAAPAANGVLCRLTFTLDVDSLGCVVQYGSYIESFANSGTYTRWIVADGASVFAIAATGAVCVSNVQVISVNKTFRVVIFDEDDNLIETLRPDDGYFDFSDGYFTANIDWETLAIPSGCYRLKVADPCPCSQGGIVALDFVTSVGAWSLGSLWTIAGGTATYNGSTTSQAELSNVICPDVTYRIEYTLTGMGAGETFQVFCGSTGGTVRSTNGTFTDTILSNGTDFFFRGNGGGTSQTFEVTDMSLIPIDADFELLTSNEIKVTSGEFGCQTYLVSMCNDTDAFGFGFENTGFSPSFRTEASLARGSYPNTRESYSYSDGVKKVTYGRYRVAREFGIDTIPHLVDFMALAIDIDHFYIDGEEYFVEDDEMPTVSWGDFDHVGGFALNVSKKTQLLENRRLSSTSVGCSPNGVALATDDNQEIKTEDNKKIIN